MQGDDEGAESFVWVRTAWGCTSALAFKGSWIDKIELLFRYSHSFTPMGSGRLNHLFLHTLANTAVDSSTPVLSQSSNRA
jgi:hypothetical protein